MQERTLKFLDKNLSPHIDIVKEVDASAQINGLNAEKRFGLPCKLWNELTASLRARRVEEAPKWRECRNSYESAIMLGFAIGWYEATNAPKKAKTTETTD